MATSMLMIPCPHCAESLRIPESAFGRRVRCRKCGDFFRAPGGEDSDFASEFDFEEMPAPIYPARPCLEPEDDELLPLDDELPPSRRWLYLIGITACLAAAISIATIAIALSSRRPASASIDPPQDEPQTRVAKADAPAPRKEAPPPAEPIKQPVLDPAPSAEPEPQQQEKVEPPPEMQPPVAQPRRNAAIDEAKQSVALIQGKFGSGSGFLVLPDVIATNSHVILCEMMENVTVRFSTDGVTDEAGLKVQLLYEDKTRDLAFLKLEKPQNRKCLPLAKAVNLEDRPEAFVIGTPAQDAGVALSNIVEPARCEEDVVLIGGKPYYQLSYSVRDSDIRIGRGNSGGPALNERGEVIGVVTRAAFSKKGRTTGTAYCIPVLSVRNALEAVGDSRGWPEKIARCSAHHAYDIATICVYANAIVAYLFVELRAGYSGSSKSLPRLTNYGVKVFHSVDKRFRGMALEANKVAGNSPHLSTDQKYRMGRLGAELDDLRKLVHNPNPTANEYRRASGCEARCQKAWAGFREESGMSDEVLRMMVIELLQEAGLEVVEK